MTIKQLSDKSFLDIDSELSKAVNYHQMGQLEKAKEAYRNILAFDPDHSDSLHLLGYVEHQSGNHDDAVELIGKAIHQNPNNPIYHNSLARPLPG